MLSFTDERIKLESELVAGMRVVKYYAWEKWFYNRTDESRERELKHLGAVNYYRALNFSLNHNNITLLWLASFTVYELISGNTLNAPIAFTALRYLCIARHNGD